MFEFFLDVTWLMTDYNAGEYPRHDLWQIKELLDSCKEVFSSACYAIGSVVGFSQQGFVLTSIDKVNKHRFPTIKLLSSQVPCPFINLWNESIYRYEAAVIHQISTQQTLVSVCKRCNLSTMILLDCHKYVLMTKIKFYSHRRQSSVSHWGRSMKQRQTEWN